MLKFEASLKSSYAIYVYDRVIRLRKENEETNMRMEKDQISVDRSIRKKGNHVLILKILNKRLNLFEKKFRSSIMFSKDRIAMPFSSNTRKSYDTQQAQD